MKTTREFLSSCWGKEQEKQISWEGYKRVFGIAFERSSFKKNHAVFHSFTVTSLPSDSK